MTFDENYGTMPSNLLALIKRANVSPADWDSMLTRWGIDWFDEHKPFNLIYLHIESHMVNGTYRYPMYG
jgi:hypothetical protein